MFCTGLTLPFTTGSLHDKMHTFSVHGLELQCLLNVKQKLSSVLIFQHAILNAEYIAWIDVVFVVKEIIVIFRKIKTILILINFKRYFSLPEKSILNLSLPYL